jgi:hypothetical protein
MRLFKLFMLVAVLLSASLGWAQYSTSPTDQLSNRLASALLWTDFSSSTQAADFTGVSVSSGTLNAGTGTALRPGVARITSAGGANSGYRVESLKTAILISGNEYFIADFSPVTLTNATVRMGICDTQGVADCTDGAYVEFAADGVLSGKTADNGTRSTSGTSYTVAAPNWYRIVIQVQSSASSVSYRLYNASGALVWSSLLTTNIPIAAGRETGPMVVATESVGGTQGILDMDLMAFCYKSDLPRSVGGT